MQYRVTIKDALSDQVVRSLDVGGSERLGEDTVLTVELRDQAALLGLVDRVSDLGLTLVAIEPDVERPA